MMGRAVGALTAILLLTSAQAELPGVPDIANSIDSVAGALTGIPCGILGHVRSALSYVTHMCTHLVYERSK